MSESIRIGLDFGTHQTKVCVRRAFDEGAGQASYEFFRFKDLNGDLQYIFPSVIQQNSDDTLSYGFIDPTKEKRNIRMEVPTMIKPEEPKELSEEEIEDLANDLFDKYEVGTESDDDINILIRMLEKKEEMDFDKYEKDIKKARDDYSAKMLEYRSTGKVYRYFKQAMFAERPWVKDIDYKVLCVWYLAYIIFCLEEKFGQTFSLNMGIPADEKNYERKRKEAISLLASAYWLVENEYENDFDSFINEKVDSLLRRTKIVPYDISLVDDYGIMVLPEAYAALISHTSRGKIPNGMGITTDIGGGTTDITFFTYSNKTLSLYRFESLPYGLNYIAEKSGFDYSQGNVMQSADSDVIESFNRYKKDFVEQLKEDLVRNYIRETRKFRSDIENALKNRAVIYSGGGSSYPKLACPISTFKDIKIIDERIWEEENIIDKDEVKNIIRVLNTCYGLSLEDNEDHVKVCKFTTLFSHMDKQKTNDRYMVDKDAC